MVTNAEPWKCDGRYLGFDEGTSDGLIGNTRRVGVPEENDTPRAP